MDERALDVHINKGPHAKMIPIGLGDILPVIESRHNLTSSRENEEYEMIFV